MKRRDTFSDWVAWLIYAFILALAFHPIRRKIAADVYSEMSSAQEIVLFIIIIVGLTIFVVRPFARAMRK